LPFAPVAHQTLRRGQARLAKHLVEVGQIVFKVVLKQGLAKSVLGAEVMIEGPLRDTGSRQYLIQPNGREPFASHDSLARFEDALADIGSLLCGGIAHGRCMAVNGPVV